VCFYGIPPADAADPAKIRAPFLAHFASDDDWCNARAVDALRKRLEAGRVKAEVHVYAGTQHAFCNEARPEVYDREAAELAFSRTFAFFERHLGASRSR
jgi:carboxymethylenebutenolidase